MDQQLRLPLETGEPFPNGLSAWLRGRPPFIGWWDTRPIFTGHLQIVQRRRLIERRWWGAAGWSLPVMVGDPDEACACAQACPSSVSWSLIEFRGLTDPPKDGYPWALDDHHRSNLAAASRARIPLAV